MQLDTAEPTPTTRRTVVVVGGGPGGSTAAALLARNGVDVLLLERETFPRYHIGESLAASCRIIMNLSGALPNVESGGFPVKRGALLRWGNEEDWTINWSELFGPEVSSWQVERDDFDQILLRNAEKQGAEVIEDATVKKVLFEGERAVGVEWVHNGSPTDIRTTRCDFVIDASGRAGILTRQHFRNRVPHDIFRNVAIWGYWDGGTRLPGTPEGGINVVSSQDGWYWVIPLRNDQTSVGFVTHQDNFLRRRKSFATTEDMLHALVEESPTVHELVKDARYYAPVRVEQDFSYVSEKFSGPGYFIAGDAACFLDPLLSTGVHLAMYSALLGSAAIMSIREKDVTEEQALAFYESLYHHAYKRLLVLVSGVYEQYKGKKTYFWLAQRLTADDSEPTASRPLNTAFGGLTSGLSDLSDAKDNLGWSARKALAEEAEIAKRRADEQAGSGVKRGISAFRLEPSDLYDAATGLHLITAPRLGLHHRG
jgi:flavin-dependent dehydrogenase